MLVLTRKAGEAIVIDGDITVTVLGLGRGGQVRIGIDAPRSRRVHRRELLDEVGAENLAAGGEVADEHLAKLLSAAPPSPRTEKPKERSVTP